MKTLGSHLTFYLSDKDAQRNVRALMKYLAFLLFVIAVFSIVFHLIMLYVEGRSYSWITGIYWTLTVMSTLGFGDITFESDIGRLFSVVVLLSGIVLLLIVLPFAFIRYFYAPWLESQMHFRAPRKVPPDMHDHVILCNYDTVAEGLVERLKNDEMPYYILEPDHTRAANLLKNDISVVVGEVDSPEAYRALNVDRARLLVANREDTVNTSITITVREVAASIPIVTITDGDEFVDVLERSGATHVLPLKKWLGEQLANRVRSMHAHANVIGRYRNLLLAELPVHNTPLADKTIRETRLREIAGVNIVAVWERGRLIPASPDLLLTEDSVPVITGTEEQLEEVDSLLFIYDINPNPVIVIGGGRVGRSAARALRQKEVPVTIIERDPVVSRRAEGAADIVVTGDASDLEVLTRAGLMEAPSVLLTTHDDSMNIFLASYCRRLNPELRIVSRISHERNIESIHRAGADFVLSYATLAVATVMSILRGKELVVLGEGLDLFSVPVPEPLKGETLARSGIGAETGLIVIGIQENGSFIGNPPASAVLEPGAELVMMGNAEQRKRFASLYR